MKQHYHVMRSLLPDWKLRQHVLPLLEAAGLIIEEPEPGHTSRKLVIPTMSQDTLRQEHRESEGGVTQNEQQSTVSETVEYEHTIPPDDEVRQQLGILLGGSSEEHLPPSQQH